MDGDGVMTAMSLMTARSVRKGDQLVGHASTAVERRVMDGMVDCMARCGPRMDGSGAILATCLIIGRKPFEGCPAQWEMMQLSWNRE